MRIRLKREDLLFQLPNGDLPENIILEGIMVSDENLKDELELKYPALKKLFTLTEYKIFRELYFMHPNAVHVRTLFPLFINSQAARSGGWSGMENNVRCHIKFLRKKIEKNKLPFEIITGVTGTKTYFLKKYES
jgi:DNA-binding response OmpR family regulator